MSLLAFPVTAGIGPFPCWCCRRLDDGIGIALGGRPERNIWSCKGHIQAAKVAAKMPTAKFDHEEKEAALTAGAMGGEYLVAIGRTDVARLLPEEYDEYIRIIITEFGRALHENVKAHAR